MSNNRGKVSISVDLIPQIYELSAVKCLNAASTIALVLKIFKEVTSKVDVCMKAFHAKLTMSNEAMIFSLVKDDKEWNLEIPIIDVDLEELKQFLLGKICFLDFLCLAAFNMSVDINTIPTAEQFMDVFETWDKYSNQIGYVEDKYTINIPDQEIRETLKEEGVVWYYGMSCSGKTYMGIKELNSYPIIKVAYNPCFSSDEEYALIKLLIYCGRNIAILLDDLQCDTEKTEELFKIIAEKKNTLKNRNIHIFMVSWVSLLTNEKFAGYQSVFKAFQVNTSRKSRFSTALSAHWMPLSNNVRKVTSENYPTDAGREGEAIFRRVYGLAGSKLPVKRLWISSMEDSAIQQGFDSLKDGAEYDNLFAASECRAKADWLIGMNGTRAFTKKYGRRQTIGRVQTPTLAMLTERQNKIQNFVKEPYYKVEITGNGIVAESERMAQEQDADTMQAACDGQCAVVGSIERKRKEQSAPKLYDLTTLQREANRYYGFTASQTLKIVQELYEEKLVTYPRTDSQYITEDMQQTMADLLKHYGGEADGVKQVVNNKKVTDHHAILPTLESCKRGSNSLSGDKEKVFALIVWKMQQAAQPPYIYEDVLVTVCCQDRKFTAKYKNVLQAGHTAMPVPFAEQEKSKDVAFPKKLEQGAVIPVVSAEKKQGFTSPPKAFTEDTLLSAMETAGNKEFEKDTEKKGLGTPATRAAILEKLVSSGYVERKGKQILPSAEGVTAIANIPDYLKSASMTAEWENELLRMEQGETKPANFMQGINGLLDKMLADLRQIPTVQESTTYNKVSIGDCPVCGKTVCEGRQNFYCSDRDCKFALWKESKYLSGMKKTLTKKMATDLLKKGRTHVKDFYSAKKDKTFAADLVMAIENGRAQYSLEFPKTPAKK